ncbi:Calmodulin-like protein 5 [Psilocybe cubensis]|uniref:Calmodulin-like protein 5 n=2 Tax=Psilocybe cubensis TaxID=181762 RepID=A0ACB8GKH1_PSICU|nr:Calmodulin-like protein 5 [Psilocybe cubensis]KAH9475892.1 Calmodulin-like protein 5 [Psilocybe cubensis]
MGALGRTPTEQELSAILREIDTDHNGTIEFDEFVDLMDRNPLSPKLAGAAPFGEDSELYYAFSVFDKDSSGKISVDELAQVMKNLGEKLTKDELDMMISEADLDGDKEINFTEFKKMVGGLSK